MVSQGWYLDFSLFLTARISAYFFVNGRNLYSVFTPIPEGKKKKKEKNKEKKKKSNGCYRERNPFVSNTTT